MPTFGERIQHAWNAFMNRDPTRLPVDPYFGYGNTSRPDRNRLTRGSDRSIVTTILNRMSMDAAAITLKHARLDDNGNYLEEIKSGLNNCLNVEANKDQTGRAFLQDVFMSLFDEGVVALVPTDTTINPAISGSFDISEMRVGKVLEWFPDTVKLRVYNERKGRKEDIYLPKTAVAIVENPMYSIMNEPNSIMQRLVRKFSLLDIVDEHTSSGKLDLIIQLPYVIKTEARRQQAEIRRKDIEMQLSGSKYGIAYTDGTERITQLNRSLENNLLGQIEFLTSMLYSQLGITEEILNGTANDIVMLNYYNRIIEPAVSAVVDEMERKFLTKTARSQKQAIYFFRDPFRLVPVEKLADIADRFTRNEILTSNEVRQIIGMPPSNNPRADELINKNMPVQDLGFGTDSAVSPDTEDLSGENQNGEELPISDDSDLAEAQEVFNTLSDEQKEAVYQIIGKLMEGQEGATNEEPA